MAHNPSQPDPGDTVLDTPEVQRAIRREIAHIAVPVGLEMIFQLLLSLIDQIIVGALGAVAIAVVGLSGSVLTFIAITLGALSSGVGILVARAHGAQDSHGVSRVAGVAAVIGVVSSAVVAIPLAFASAPFLKLIGAAPEVIAAGFVFLRILLLMLPLAMIGGVAGGALRSLGQARAPLYATFVAVIFNTVAGYILVFGVGPFPKLGLVGAGVATFLSQALKTVLLMWRLYGPGGFSSWELPAGREEWLATSKRLVTLSLPLGAKDMAWSFGLFCYTLIFQKLGTNILAAGQIISALENLFMLASIGLMISATTLIGQAIGKGDGRLAHLRANTLLHTGVVTGVGFGSIYLCTAFLLPFCYRHVGHFVLHVASIGIVLSALYQPLRVRNIILGGGILPSTGNTRTVIEGDAGGAFLVGLPLAWALAFPLGLGVWGVFAARAVEEVVKMLWFQRKARRIHWETVAREHAHTASPAAV